jgi:hypothetical protein
MTLQKDKTKKNKDGNKCDCEGADAEGSLVAAGTELERLLSVEDAVCLCLGKLKDVGVGVEMYSPFTWTS